MDEGGRDGAVAETDERFPSGPWAGFYVQQGIRVRQRMGLRFAEGLASGEGRDAVGSFVISGAYDVGSGAVRLQKCYEKHSVAYSGWAEGSGDDGIWGTWVIESAGVSDRGGFHIWPEASKAGSAEGLEAFVGERGARGL